MIEKGGRKDVPLDYIRIIIRKAFSAEVLKREHLPYAGKKIMILEIAAKDY